MRGMNAWMLVLAVSTLGLAGCKDKTAEPIEEAPAQAATLPIFPEDQVPDPEPQPAAPQVPAKPVDTTAGQQLPKESYSSGAQGGQTYVVKQGDTLQQISRQFYKTNTKWRDIYNANRDVMTKGPDQLEIGMKLKIP